MGRKKAGDKVNPQACRPFCYFCDRTFDDENILIQHQRAKHFRCQECDDTAVRGKCESVQGLIVHTLKVHSKSLPRVPNALQGRDNPELNVYGMDGVPAEILKQRGIDRPELVGKAAPPPSEPASGLEAMASWSTQGMSPMAGQPGGMPSMPGMPPIPGVPAAPSLEGFQQFLAAQKAPNSMVAGASAPVPPATDTFGSGFPPQAGLPGPPADGQPTTMALPPPASLAGGSNGGTPAQQMPQKRRWEEEDVAGEDISVEERRALLDRYRIPR